MKQNFLTILFIVFLSIIYNKGFSQSYNATIQQSINGSILSVDLYLRTTSGTSDILGDATLVISYNTSALIYIGKDLSYDGPWDNSSDSYNNLTSSNEPPYASLDITKSGDGSGLDIPTSATRVGRINFMIEDANQNSNVAWETGS
jgi:hypothetical protein